MMSKQQMAQIEELRKAGIGYGTIAKKLHMNKNTVCAFCIRHGLGGVRCMNNLAGMTTVYEPKGNGSRKNRDIVCTVKITFEPWKPKAV